MKMNVNGLKVGDKVFISEDLVHLQEYGNAVYYKVKGSGERTIAWFYNDNKDAFFAEENGCYYTAEMIDWNKTKNLQNDNCHNFEKITQFVENGREKTIALTNNGKEFTVTNNDKENDIEKSVMMLMLKSLGVTYSDVKKEVEKVKVKWRPAEDDRYYYIREIGDISSCFWSELSWDYYRFDFNNCFKTIEEAEEKVEKIKEVLRGE